MGNVAYLITYQNKIRFLLTGFRVGSTFAFVMEMIFENGEVYWTMNRETEDLINAVKELDAAFDAWVTSIPGRSYEEEFRQRTKMSQAVGKVKGLAFILERSDREFSHFQHSEHLYGTENSRG